MNLLNRILAIIREEHTLGAVLKYTERYNREDYWDFWENETQNIIVPADAETFADVSFYQAGMDWSRYPHRAAIIRIGQNVWKDSSFETFYTDARKAGKVLGGYWFYDDRVSPSAQANVLINAMLGKSFEMELFIDYEKVYGGAYQGIGNVIALMQLVEANGVKCKAVGMYTGYYFMYDNAHPTITQKNYLAARPLWLAWYASPGTVRVPEPWGTWTHWQYGTPVADWGQPTQEIDANRHNGSSNDFAIRYLGGSVPPDNGGTVKTYYLSVTADPAKQFRNPDGSVDVGPNLQKGTTFTSTSTNGVTYRNDSSGRYVKVTHVHLDNVVDVPIDPPPTPPPADARQVTVTVAESGWETVSATVTQKKA